MRKRQVWVEPLFAEAKDWHGLRRFCLSGGGGEGQRWTRTLWRDGVSPSGPCIIEADPRQWREFRTLRLDALRRDPSAYASTDDETLARPEAFW
jgi:hypothetical protein